MPIELSQLGSNVRENPIRDIKVVRVLNSPGPWRDIRWNVRITYWDQYQQEFQDISNSRIFPPIYDQIDMFGDGPSGDVSWSFEADKLKLFFECYPNLTTCGGT